MIDANRILMFSQSMFNASAFSISSIISSVSSGRCLAKSPCVNALSFFFGAPVDLPPCILQRPFAIAQFLQGFPVRFDLAPHLFGPRGCFVSMLFLLSQIGRAHV